MTFVSCFASCKVPSCVLSQELITEVLRGRDHIGEERKTQNVAVDKSQLFCSLNGCLRKRG